MKLHNSLAYLKGSSAAGKGTRVSQLMVFLIDGLGLKYKIKSRASDSEFVIPKKPPKAKPDWEPDMDKKYVMGLRFPELNILFCGRMAKSHGTDLISFNGLDYFFSQTKIKATQLITEFAPRYNIILEGMASATISGNAPWNAVDDYGIEECMFQYYIFDSYLHLLGRAINRSGEPIKGTCWPHNLYFQREYEKAVSYKNGKPKLGANLVLNRYTPRAKVTSFGEDYLRFLGRENLVKDFLRWSKQKDTKRSFHNPKQNNPTMANLYDEFKVYAKDMNT